MVIHIPFEMKICHFRNPVHYRRRSLLHSRALRSLGGAL